MQNQIQGRAADPEIDWREGRTPVSNRFSDPYFSIEDGLAETRYVFLQGNDLPDRFLRRTDPFRIAELGFGTGLNALATLTAWSEAGRPCPLRLTSFEAFPLPREDMARALAAFPVLDPALLFAALDGQVEGARLDLIIGDARQTLPLWQAGVEAWFLDGFSPARNPELWEPALLTLVADRLTPGGTLATYTAAGHVRRALAAAGLEVERRPGYGRKRHMTVARKPA